MRTVCITGGARGIGRALAVAFAREGYRVSIMDLHREAGFEVIRQIRSMGGKALFLQADASEERDMERWTKLTLEEFGSLDVMIHNAGIARNGFLLDLTVEDFDRVIAVNLRGAFLAGKHAARAMIERQTGGSIILIASTRALMSEPNTEAYSASKGGILALTHAMAVSLGHYGIRVNAVSPGWIETGPWQYSPEAVEPVHSERDRLQHPVGRVGEPMDIASACLFLAGPGAGFITGQNLVVDGGMTIRMIYED